MWEFVIGPGVVALLVFHFVCRRWLGIPHAMIWTGIDCGFAAASGYLFWETFPWGHITASSWSTMHRVEPLSTLYMQITITLLIYYAVSAYVSGSASSWWWALTHVVILPLVTAFILLDHQTLALRYALPPSVYIRVLALCIRYQIWLAKDSVVALQLHGHSRISWYYAIWMAFSIHSLYQLCMWIADHGDLMFPK